MEQKNGAFVVIEGTDGSGKAKQLELLRERLEQSGYEVETFDFPRYDQPSSHFVQQYLNGQYGTAAEVGPYTASLFYALDRFEAATQIREALAAGKIVLSNRFTASSMAYQGSKFIHAEERRGYFVWLDNLEFLLLRIPRPDMNFVLRVPAELDLEATNETPDTSKVDLESLQKSVQAYDDLCSLFPQDFQRIDCVRGRQLLSTSDTQKIVWEKVSAVLPKPSSKPRTKLLPTQLPQVTTQKADKLAVKPVTMSLLAELNVAKIRSGVPKLSVDFSRKDASGNYQFYVPKQLSAKLAAQYKIAMNSIFELHSELQFRMQDYLAKSSTNQSPQEAALLLQEAQTSIQGVLPLAAQDSYQIPEPPEAATLPPLVRRELLGAPTKPESPNLVARLASTTLKETYSDAADDTTLVHAWPRNELDLVPDILYPFSGMALRDIQTAVSGWNYDQKAATLIAYAADPSRDPSALKTCRYQFDIVSDIHTLQSAIGSTDHSVTWQAMTPRYGYAMPELVELAGLSELYERCFDISLELNSALQTAGNKEEAAYAMLLGHKVRWQLSTNGQALLCDLPQPLRHRLREKMLTRHPLLVSEYR